MKKEHLIISTICLLLSGGIGAQVTIGSGQAPLAGALLDLKTAPDGTSNQGMLLPRVKLSALNKLAMSGSDIPDGTTNEYNKHTGLWVYNVSGEAMPKCAPIPDGLYIWDGAKWNGINVTKADPASLTISGADINFPSGLDLRPMPTVPETFTIDWTPSYKPVAYTNVDHSSGGITYNGANKPPADGNLTTSPTTFSLLPNAMLAGDIATNPFLTKQNTLTFTVPNECGSPITEVRVVNQTNKALTVSTPYKEYTANASNTTNTLTTNADWKLVSIMPADATTAISNVRVGSPTASLATGVTQTDYEQNNNAGKATTLTYDIAVGATKARYSRLTFEDAAATKRFRNVTITVLQCTNVGLNPTIEQWALTAEFTQTEIDDVKSSGADSRILLTGIQLHRDQSNNLFLSSNFGSNPLASDARWMIHNLAATQFDTGVIPVHSLSGPDYNSSSYYDKAYWAYPGKNINNYSNNQRLGRLYTWDAATAGKGGADGKATISDGGTPHTNVQGICPKGWYLPSDYDYTVLENLLISNTSAFSGTSTIGGAELPFSTTDDRGTLHGKAMKEICEPAYPKINQGTSNGINSTDRPGFDALFAGYANDGSASEFETGGSFWSASSGGNIGTNAWYRFVGRMSSKVLRTNSNRSYLLSVRCKK